MATKIPTKKWPEGWESGCDPYTGVSTQDGNEGCTQQDGEEG